jgi:hypothetical protein
MRKVEERINKAEEGRIRWNEGGMRKTKEEMRKVDDRMSKAEEG